MRIFPSRFVPIRTRRVHLLAAAAAAATALAPSAYAVPLYWDTNGPADGTDTAGGTWSATAVVWNESAAGTAGPGTWVGGSEAVFSAGGNATNAFTVTVQGTQVVGGMVWEEGVVTLQGGTIQLAGPSATFEVSGATGATIGSVLAGTGQLVKAGAGALHLTSASPFAGQTTVAGGALFLNGAGSGLAGAVQVNAGAYLAGTGVVGGAVTVQPGGAVSPGVGGMGALTVGQLVVQPGSFLEFDLGVPGASDRIVATSQTNGFQVLGGGTINVFAGAGFGPGTYTLVDYLGTFGGNLANLSFGSRAQGYRYTLVNNLATTSVDLVVGLLQTTWTRNGDGFWGSPDNWSAGVPNEAGFGVTFGPAITAPRTVVVDGNYTAGDLWFNSANSYTLAGSGSLTLDVPEDQGPSSFTPGNVLIEVSQGDHTIAVPLQLNDSLTVNHAFETGTSLTLAGGVSGSTLTKTGDGNLVLANAVTFSGGVAVNRGSLTLDGAALEAADGVSVGTDATLRGTGNVAGAVTVASGGTVSPGNTIGTLTVGALTLADGASLSFDLGEVSDLVNVTGANGLTLNGGAFSFTAGPGFRVGTYTLLDYAGTLGGSLGNLSVEAAAAGFVYSLFNDVESTSIRLAVTATAAGAWAVDASGNWSVASNWGLGAVPDTAAETATFGRVITAPRTVTLDGPQVVGSVVFDSTERYAIVGPGSLTVVGTPGQEGIRVLAGGHTIGVNLGFDGPANIAVAGGAGLTLSGALGLDGSLTKTGAGTLALGPLSLGDTEVTMAGGTLAVPGLTMSGGTFTHTAGTVVGGPVLLRPAHSELPPVLLLGPGAGAASYVIRDFGTVVGDIPAPVSVNLAAPDGFGDFTFAGVFTNAGNLSLTIGSSSESMVFLNLDGQGERVLTNTGTFTIHEAVSDVYLTGSVVNGPSGVMSVGATLRPSGDVTNLGALGVGMGESGAEGGGLWVVGADRSFNQLGGTLTSNGNVVVVGGTFNYGGGSVVGTVRLEPDFDSEEEATFYPTLNFGTASGSGTFRLSDGGTLAGAGVPAGVTVLHDDGAIATPVAFGNAGTVVASGNWFVGSVGGGTLTNTGSFDTTAGIEGHFVNAGVASFGGDTPVYSVVNSGVVTVAPFSELRVGAEGFGDYVQTAGTTTVGAGAEMMVEGVLRMSGGTIFLASGEGGASLHVNAIEYDGTATPALIMATGAGTRQTPAGVYVTSSTFVEVRDGLAANDLTIAAPMFGPNIVKLGAGTLALTGNNSGLFGGIEVRQGVVSVAADRSLGDVEASLRLNGGTLLAVSSFATGRSIEATNGTIAVAPGFSLRLTGILEGPGPVTKAGFGMLEMAGEVSGVTTLSVSAGTLRAGVANALGDTQVLSVAAGATFDTGGLSQALRGLSGSGSVLLSYGNDLSLGLGGASSSFGGIIAGEGSVTKVGAGVVTLGGTNTYTSVTNVAGGTLRLGSNGALPASTKVMFSGGGALDTAGRSPTVVGLAGVGVVGNSGGALSTLTLQAPETEDNTFGGSIGGNVAVRKLGAGVQRLSGSNSFTGGLFVGGGLVELTGANSFSGGITLAGSGAQAGILEVGFDAAMGAGANSITLAGGRLRADASFATARGMSVTAASSVEVVGGATLTYGGVLAGTGALRKLGEGTLLITSNSPFSGPLDLSAGTIKLAGPDGTLGASTVAIGGGTLFGLDNAGGDNGSRLSDGADVVLRGGTFEFVGAAGVNSAEVLGRLVVQAGGSTVSLVNGAGGTTSVTFSELGARAKGATVNFAGQDLGGTNRVIFGAAPAGIAGDPVPGTLGAWATVNGVDWAKHVSGSGVVAFGAGDYVANDLSAGGHVRLTGSVAGVGDVSVRTLNIVAGGGAVEVGQVAGSVLTLPQGGLLKSGAGAATIGGGIIRSGTDELNVYASGGELRLAGVVGEMVGGTDFIKAGPGTVYLGGGAFDTRANAYSGVTRVQGGTLVLDKAEGTFAIPGNLEVSGGTLLVNRPGQINPNAEVLLTGGVFNLNGRTEAFKAMTNNGGTLLFNGGTMNVDGITLISGRTIVASDLVAGSFLTIMGGDNQIRASGNVTVTGTTTFTGDASPGITIFAGATPGRLNLAGNLVFDGTAGTGQILTTAPLAGETPGTVDLGGVGRTFTIGDGAASVDMRVSARIQNGTLTKSGAGTLRLEGANTYAGGTVLSAGVLEASDPGALGAGPVTFSSTATLLLRSDAAAVTFNNPITVSTPTRDVSLQIERNTVGTTGTFTAASLTLGRSLTLNGTTGGTLRVPGNVTLQSNVTLNNAVTLDLQGAVTGAFGVTKTLTGMLVYGGAGANTYTGGTTVNSGVLQLQKSGGATAVPAGALAVNGPATVRLMGDHQVADGTAVTLNGVKGTALLDLNNFSDTVSALSFVAGGNVNTGFGVLTITGDVAFSGAVGSGVITGNLAMAGAGPRRFTVADGAAANDLQVSATISGTQGLIKDGPGRLLLDGFNSFTGGITVNAGALYVTNDSSLNANVITLAGGTLVSTGALSAPVSVTGAASVETADALTLTGVVSGGAAVTKVGAGVLTLAGANSLSGAVNVTGGVLAVPSAAALGAPASVNVSNATFRATGTVSTARPFAATGGTATFEVAAGQTLSLGAGLGGAGAVGKTGAGTLALGGPVTVGGVTSVLQGALNLNSAQSFPGGLAVGAGTVNVNVDSSVTGSLSSLGGGVINHSNRTLTISGSGATSFAGNLRISGGAGGSVVMARTGGTGSAAAGASIQVDAGGTLALAGPVAVFGSGGTIAINNDSSLLVSGGANVIGVLSGEGSTGVGGGSLSVSVVRQAGLTVSGGVVSVRPGAVANELARTSVVDSLSIGGVGTLDLGNSSLVIDYAAGASPLETVRAYLASGRGADGSWGGPGIVSAAAAGDAAMGIAYVEASELLGLSGGQTAVWGGVTVDASSLLLIYTFAGDANLNGVVDRDDYALLDRGFVAGGSSWVRGDFDYSGTVTSADYLVLDRTVALRAGGVFEPGLLAMREARFGAAYVEALVASVPEPGCVGVILATGVGLLGGRRRRWQ